VSEAVRRRVIRPDASFLVQAPAGAGKTELLTRRVLALLACVNEPEEILAITFTRKAAAEMRTRVHQALVMDTPCDGNPHALARQELARAARARSRQRGWRLEEHPARLRVMTLDALAAGLARQMPLSSGLGATPAPLEDARPEYRRAAEAALDAALHDAELTDDAARLLLHLDNQTEQLLKLIAAMLERRENWLPWIARHGRDMDVLRGMLERNLAAVMRARLAAADARIPDAIRRELPGLIRFAGETLGDAELAAFAGWPAPEPEMLPDWRRAAGMLLTAGGELRKPGGVNRNMGFPPECRDEKARMKHILEAAADAPGLAAALQAVRRLPDGPRFDDAQWRVAQALLRLLPLANAELEKRFAVRGAMDFTGIALGALAALSDDMGRPTDVLLRLDDRIRHVLVDEFQDTSELQVRLLRCLTAGWEPGDGRTLFLVGDPMQSIYRFRKAEVGLFLRAAAGGAGLPPLRTERLERNFRSTPAVVEWVNNAFGALFPDCEDAVHGAIPLARARAHRGGNGGVWLHVGEERDDAREAARVVELVQAAREAGRRVGILGRTRKHLRETVRALTQAGVPFRAVDVLPLADAPEVRALRALARALLHPADAESWLGVLRMPVCALDTRDLWRLMRGPGDTVWARLNDEATLARLQDAARARFARDALAPCVAASGRTPVRDLVGAAWRRLGMDALLDDTARVNAGRMLDLLARVEAESGVTGTLSLARLDECLDKLYAAPDARPEALNVEVLTMHGAKGLQWDTVILPGLGRAEGNSGMPSLLAFTETVVDGETGLLLAPRAPTRERDAVYDLVRGIENEKERLEDARLLYVACTRAERELHLLGHVSGKTGRAEAGSFLAMLYQAGGETVFGAEIRPLPAARSEEEQAPRRPITRLAHLPALPPLAAGQETEAPAAYAWAGFEAAPVGNAVHAALELVGRTGIEQWTEQESDALWERMRRWLLAEGLSGETLETAWARAVAALRRALESERGRWVLSGAHRDAHCEWEICTREAGGGVTRHVIDRAFVADGVRWIIDYKTATHEGGDLDRFLDEEARRHAPQLMRYARALRLLAPDVPVRAALYFPMLDAWREVQTGQE